MPDIKIKHIVSFSSEDKVFKAENLLKLETYRKWKCATPGEKNASVVLQFEKATQIHAIHIGNEHSAFVEVLVGRSSDTSNDYKVLLVASSFMSPLESRNGTNVNRVRIFEADKLTQNLKDEKWDRVELVCSQPFNKNVQYGLSFVKFMSPPEPEEKEISEPKLMLGRFKVKNSDDEEDSPLQRGAWFQKKRDSIDDKFSTSPSAIRQAATSFAASTLALAESKVKSPSTPTNVKRKEMEDNGTNIVPAKKKDSSVVHVNRDKVGYKNILQADLSSKPNASPKQEIKAKPQLPQETHRENKKPEIRASPKASGKKPKHKLMERVVFVLSGFQNPERSMIRDFAIEMGAKYKADWDSSCTHLVCAFINTPKYVQVRSAGGRVVTRNWILDCYKKSQLLPWRKYMLGKYKKSSSSEEEEDEEVQIVRQANTLKNGSEKVSRTQTTLNSSLNGETSKAAPSAKTTEKKSSPVKKKNSAPSMSDENESAESDYRADTDVDSVSGGNTEDEIEKVESEKRNKNKNHLSSTEKSPKKQKFSNHSPLMEERPDTSDLPLPELPDFFKKKHFFLYGSFSEKERHDLERYITAYNGTVANYMDDNVKYVVTLSKWNDKFDEAVNENDNLIFVHPRWVYKCHQNHKLVPYQPHIIVPDE